MFDEALSMLGALVTRHVVITLPTALGLAIGVLVLLVTLLLLYVRRIAAKLARSDATLVTEIASLRDSLVGVSTALATATSVMSLNRQQSAVATTTSASRHLIELPSGRLRDNELALLLDDGVEMTRVNLSQVRLIGANSALVEHLREQSWINDINVDSGLVGIPSLSSH